MTPSEFQDMVKDRSSELSQYIHRKLPVKAGAKVKAIVQQNFRLGGFQNGALEKWPETRRQSSGSGADSRRGPLLSSRKVLYEGTGYTPGDACVTIYYPVTFPAALISFGETEWTSFNGTDSQRGKGTFTVRLDLSPAPR